LSVEIRFNRALFRRIVVQEQTGLSQKLTRNRISSQELDTFNFSLFDSR